MARRASSRPALRIRRRRSPRPPRRSGCAGLVADPWLWDATGQRRRLQRPRARSRARPRLDRALDLLGTELRRNRDPDALVRGHIAIQGMGSASKELERGRQGCGRRGRDGAQPAPVVLPGRCRDRRRSLRAVTRSSTWRRLGVLGDNCVFAHMNILRDDEVEPIVRKRHVDRLVPRRIDDVGRRRHDPRSPLPSSTTAASTSRSARTRRTGERGSTSGCRATSRCSPPARSWPTVPPGCRGRV